MQHLSTPLENMLNGAKQQDAKSTSSSIQQHGSMAAVGTTNSLIPILRTQHHKMSPDQIDNNLKAVAKSLLNSSITFQTNGMYSKDGEYMGTRITPVISKADHASLMEVYRVTDDMCAPGGRELVMKEIYALSVVMARRKDEETDYKVLVSVYAEDLAEFPVDVISDVCKEVRRTQKFFPTISDLRNLCVERIMFRTSLRGALSKAICTN